MQLADKPWRAATWAQYQASDIVIGQGSKIDQAIDRLHFTQRRTHLAQVARIGFKLPNACCRTDFQGERSVGFLTTLQGHAAISDAQERLVVEEQRALPATSFRVGKGNLRDIAFLRIHQCQAFSGTASSQLAQGAD